jgi:hypothetical protein
MTGRLIPCIGQDGEFASDHASRQAACKWLGDLLDEGKRWSEARREIAQYYAAAGMEERIAHAKSKGAKGSDQAVASRFGGEDGGGCRSRFQESSGEAGQKEEELVFPTRPTGASPASEVVIRLIALDAGATAFQRGFMFGKDHCSQADRQSTGWRGAEALRK